VAGAAHGERTRDRWNPARHGYSFGEVRRRGDGLVLRVHPRLWSDAKKKFAVDVDGVPDGQTYAEHPLGVTLPRAADHDVPVEAPPTVKTGSVPPPPAPKEPIRVFLSFVAPADEEGKTLVEKALTMVKRAGVDIEVSSSGSSGVVPRGSVDPLLQRAHVILLLFTPDYFFSAYCFEVEMEAARLRNEAGEAAVYAVIVKDVEISTSADFKLFRSGERREAWFEQLPRLPYARGRDSLGKPVLRNHDGYPLLPGLPSADAAIRELAREIREELETLRKNGRIVKS
jgi:hypothetical protein